MKNVLYSLILIPTIFACSNHKEQVINKNDYKNSTTPNSIIFFRNVRQSYYDLEEHKVSKSEMFRISEREISEDKPNLNVMIRHVPIQEKAFVMIEPNALLNELDTIIVFWSNSAKNTAGKYELPKRANMEQHFRFATELYQSIQSGQTLEIRTKENGKQAFWKQPDANEPFRKTMVDYYRLINVIK
jgi:hypothetical protein